MELNKFPLEVLSLIYQYDPTYKILLKYTLDEIKDEVICRINKPINNRNTYIYFRFLGTINHFNMKINEFNYSLNFSKLKYITFLEDRFIYRNNSLEQSRNLNIDTRIKKWNWYIIFDNKFFVSCKNLNSDIRLNISSGRYFDNLINISIDKKSAMSIKFILDNQFSKIRWKKIYINHFTSPCGDYTYKNSFIREYGTNYLDYNRLID